MFAPSIATGRAKQRPPSSAVPRGWSDSCWGFNDQQGGYRMRATIGALTMAVVTAATSASAADGSQKLSDRIKESATTLQEIHAVPDKDIPQDLWDKASCV